MKEPKSSVLFKDYKKLKQQNQKLRDSLEEIVNKQPHGFDYQQLAMDLQKIAQQALDEDGEI